MQFTTAAISAMFAAGAYAAPRPNPVANAQSPVPTDGSTPPPSCALKAGSVSAQVAVYMPYNQMPSSQGSGSWGGGLLDNVNGQGVCLPTNWQAVLDNTGGVGATFDVPLTCNGYNIAQAINAASGQWVYCDGDTLNQLFDTAGNVFSAYSEYIGNVASLLGSFAPK